MFKLVFLLFLAWLAFKMIRAGKFVRGLMKGVEEVMAAAADGSGDIGSQSGRRQADPRQRASGEAAEVGEVTVHRKTSAQSRADRDVEDAHFRDV
ncbi:MAG: hypothetical protein ACI80V_003291 [Rhodothermales bacterium]|jgi:hypothetical protein